MLHLKCMSIFLSAPADRKQIGTVSATDRDSGPNGDVSYRLLYTVDANSKFAVDSRTGSISTTEKLDYESIQQHVLYVRAQDAGSPQLNSKCSLCI